MRRALTLLLVAAACGEAPTTELETIAGTDAGVSPTCEQIAHEAECAAAGCSWEVCRDCDGAVLFADCSGPGFVPSCPELVCPQADCGQLDASACAARTDCHRVFRDDHFCECDALGCCAYFDRCADGAADCSDAHLGCRQAPPLCEGPYVIGYQDVCYEGCVLASDCPP